MDPNNSEWYTVLFPGGDNQDTPPGCGNAVGTGCVIVLAVVVLIVVAIVASAFAH